MFFLEENRIKLKFLGSVWQRCRSEEGAKMTWTLVLRLSIVPHQARKCGKESGFYKIQVLSGRHLACSWTAETAVHT